MNARFAEHLREKPLDLAGPEIPIAFNADLDGRVQRNACLSCEKDIHIGVFFDGTNNNKYRDTPGYSQSNVARLYEVFPGTPAVQKAPVLRPRVLPDGGTRPRPIFPDSAFKAASVAPDDFPYYRKIYVPGLGTPMSDAGDKGGGLDRSLGLGAALGGQARLEWALLQLVNQVHAAIFKSPLEASVDVSDRWRTPIEKFALLHPGGWVGSISPESARRIVQLQDSILPFVERWRFEQALAKYEARLTAALGQRGDNKPRLRKIRLSVFGFSRGAALARAWVNLVTQRWGSTLAGIELQVDFLGLFDTVASVGAANSFPFARRQYEWSAAGWAGHDAWSDGERLVVPPGVKRCAHLVASMEVRGSFPLDSVCQNGRLPENCKEVVYPGVHSDVGGGYAPDEQGRALGVGTAADQKKLSQIPLAQMYREARMAGVPLAPWDAMVEPQKASFTIAPELRDDFNAYVAATQPRHVPPPRPGDGAFARMWPTETQPREETFRIIRRHYGYTLRWRRDLQPDGVARLPCLRQAQGTSRYQDIEDFRGAEAELREELAFVKNRDPRKFGPPWYEANQHDKQHEWDTWLQIEWSAQDAPPVKEAVRRLMASHVHDSRAWFKVIIEEPGPPALAPNDEDWFVFGDRERELAKRLRQLGDKDDAASRDEIQRLQTEGPLIRGGREAYKAWGYLRHRVIYESGQLKTAGWDTRQKTVERDEEAREREAAWARLLAQEEGRHRAALEKIDKNLEEAVRRRADSGASWDDLRAGAASQRRSEIADHEATIRRIEASFGTKTSVLAGAH